MLASVCTTWSSTPPIRAFTRCQQTTSAIRKDVWDGLPEDIQRIFEVAMQKLAFQTSLTFEVENIKAANMLTAQKGVTLRARRFNPSCRGS